MKAIDDGTFRRTVTHIPSNKKVCVINILADDMTLLPHLEQFGQRCKHSSDTIETCGKNKVGGALYTHDFACIRSSAMTCPFTSAWS